MPRVGLRTASWLSIALGAAGCGHTAPAVSRRASAPGDEHAESALAAPIEEPARRSLPSAPTPPPEVPAVLAGPRDVTLSLARRSTAGASGAVTTERETIARCADRVHIERADAAIEWLFVRNAVDSRRVAGILVDHRQRVIVDYDESELRMTGIARGWADVAALGARYDALAGLMPTGRRRERWGVSFVELAQKGGAAPRLWWSEDVALALPSDAAESVELLSLERRVDSAVFAEPRRRFPGYAAFDVADYREEHHDAPRAPARGQAAHQ